MQETVDEEQEIKKSLNAAKEPLWKRAGLTEEKWKIVQRDILDKSHLNNIVFLRAFARSDMPVESIESWMMYRMN